MLSSGDVGSVRVAHRRIVPSAGGRWTESLLPHTDNPIKTGQVYKLVKSMVGRKIPIDGVGLQFHWSLGPFLGAWCPLMPAHARPCHPPVSPSHAAVPVPVPVPVIVTAQSQSQTVTAQSQHSHRPCHRPVLPRATIRRGHWLDSLAVLAFLLTNSYTCPVYRVPQTLSRALKMTVIAE